MGRVEAGFASYELGPHGLLQAARVYDSVVPPDFDWREARAATSCIAATVAVTAGSRELRPPPDEAGRTWRSPEHHGGGMQRANWAPCRDRQEHQIMRRDLPSSLLAYVFASSMTAAGALTGCAAEAADPEGPDLGEAAAEEPAFVMVTAFRGADFAGCVASADAIEGIDIFVELPGVRTFVVSASIGAAAAQTALRELPCVELARFNVEEALAYCTDFSSTYCFKAFECASELLANLGITTHAECVEFLSSSCQGFSEECIGVDAVAGDQCNTEVATGTCEQFDASLDGEDPYAACNEVCVNGVSPLPL